jgi:hypothetical protein
MVSTDLFSHFPLNMTVEADGETREYFREPDCFAIHGPVPSNLTSAVLYSFGDPAISVCRGAVSALSTLPADLTITPVYRLGHHGPQGVPSGRVFIRFSDTVQVKERQEELTACGYFISETLSYAPHAAWLQSMDGNIATALRTFAKLRALHDVVWVEPQMFMRPVQRSADDSP